jgi:hypothetical protein
MRAFKALAMALLAVAASVAGADAPWPSKPVRFIVPGAAGSAPDIRARLIAPKLAAALGQPVLVDNLPCAGQHRRTRSGTRRTRRPHHPDGRQPAADERPADA